MKSDKGLPARLQILIDRLGGRAELAEIADVTPQAVGLWLGGKGMYRETLKAIAKGTGVSARWLMTGEGEMIEGTREVSARIYEGAANENSARGKLLWALDKMNLTVPQLAKLTKYKGDVLQAVINGNGRITPNMAKAIAKEIPLLTQDDLLGGSEWSTLTIDADAGADEPRFQLPGKHPTRDIKVLSWAAAGTAQNAAAFDDHHDFKTVSSNVPGRAYGIEIKGDSMYPEINPGDVVVFRADIEASPGSLVLVRTFDGDVYCKRYSTKDGGKFVVLSSVNRTYQPMEIKAEDIAWIYPIKQVVRNY